MKISDHFDLREFVPKDIWDQYGKNSTWFIDWAIVEGAEWLRELFGKPIIINNWHTGGTFQNRGFRHPHTTAGARLSQHKFGRAIDFNVVGVKPDEVYDALIKEKGMIQWTAIEDKAFTPTWTHIDCRFTNQEELLIVKP